MDQPLNSFHGYHAPRCAGFVRAHKIRLTQNKSEANIVNICSPVKGFWIAMVIGEGLEAAKKDPANAKSDSSIESEIKNLKSEIGLQPLRFRQFGHLQKVDLLFHMVGEKNSVQMVHFVLDDAGIEALEFEGILAAFGV